jgi:hypothetical protein
LPRSLSVVLMMRPLLSWVGAATFLQART